MTEIKISEINITNILIVIFVGSGGVLGVFFKNEVIASSCFAGLIGYLARGYNHNKETIKEETSEDILQESEQYETKIDDEE